MGLHELRTRKMGDQALVDAHILVDPRISVSEGHFIAERARKAVLDTHEVLDVMVHIDPEDDAVATPSAHLPSREELIAHLNAALPDGLPRPERIVLHYLGGKVEAELFMPEAFCLQADEMARLRAAIGQLLLKDPLFRSVRLEKSAH